MLFLYLAAIENHDNDDKFMKLYKAYEEKVYSIAIGFTKNQYDAEEATQSAFFALARNIDKIDLENEDETKIYVYKAAKSASFDILRKNSKSPRTVSMKDFFTLSSTENPEDSLINDEKLEKIIKAINDMPEYYRDVLTYHYLGGFSVKEISVLLNKPISTVKSQLKRGKELLNLAVKGEALL